MVGVAKYTDQAKSEGDNKWLIFSAAIPHYVDQLISGQECGGILKEGLTTGHQKTSHQHGEIITQAIISDTTNAAATTGTTSVVIDGDGPVTTVVTDIDQSSTPQ